MYPYIHIHGIEFHVWSVFLHLSYITAIAFFVYFKPKDFILSRAQLLIAGILFTVCGLFGARLFGILVNLVSHPSAPIKGIINRSGMAYLGVPLFGFISLWIFSAITMTSFLKNADYIAPFIMLSRSIGRIGCLLNGCCYGLPSNLPWAVGIYSRPGLRHPTQLYASIAALAIFITMFLQYKKLRRYSGATFFGVLSLYSFLRFFNEFLRADSFSVIGAIKLSHVVMALIFIVTAMGFLYSIRRCDNHKTIFKEIAFHLFSSLFWISFISLGILTSIRVTNEAMPRSFPKKNFLQVPTKPFKKHP